MNLTSLIDKKLNNLILSTIPIVLEIYQNIK